MGRRDYAPASDPKVCPLMNRLACQAVALERQCNRFKSEARLRFTPAWQPSLALRSKRRLADGEGFEPSVPFWSTHAFQACTIDHSVTHPEIFLFLLISILVSTAAVIGLD